MNTQKIISNKSELTVLSFTIAIVFFIASCNKDENLLPGNVNNSTISGSLKQAGSGNSDARPLAIITIDHQAARTSLPDYSVTLYNNGTVLFDGRRNVSHIGQVAFDISPQTMQEFNMLMNSSNFFNIVDNNSNEADLPMTTTTFAYPSNLESESVYSGKTKSLIDYDNGYPAELISLRIKVEQLLNIPKLIYFYPTGETPVSQPGF